MSKRKSRVKFALIALVTIIGLVLTCFSFKIPFTTYTFEGFARAVNLSKDVDGGVLAVYEVSVDNDDEFTAKYEQTLNNFKTILSNKGIKDASVKTQGENLIRIEVGNNSSVDMISTFETLSNNSEFKITRSGEEEAVMDGSHLKAAKASFQENEWGVALVFTDEGKELFSNITKEASSNGTTTGKIDIWLDGNVILSPQVAAAITYGSTFISGMGSESTAEDYANRFLSSTFEGQLKLITNEEITPVAGKNALMFILIALGIALVISMVVMAVRYGVLGILADFATVIYTILFAFFLQAVPFIELSISGFAAILVGYVLLYVGNILAFERIREEYAAGKKIPASVTSGFKKTWLTVLDINVVACVFAILLLILGAVEIYSFAGILLVGSLLALFTSVIVTKGLVKYYLPINSTKAKKFRLTREGK